MLEKCKRVLIDAPSVLDYQEFGDPQARDVILLLHGYGQNSDEIKNSFNPLINEKAHWIIPNGVFPMPRRRGDLIKYKFAWYFYDNFKQRYYIDFEYPSIILSTLLERVAKNKSVTIIGYSQGGYLSPFIAQKTKLVKRVIGINCNYRHDMLDERLDFELSAIHGVDDPIVCPKNSENSFEMLRPRIKSGDYYKVEGATHDIDNNIIHIIQSLLN